MNPTVIYSFCNLAEALRKTNDIPELNHRTAYSRFAQLSSIIPSNHLELQQKIQKLVLALNDYRTVFGVYYSTNQAEYDQAMARLYSSQNEEIQNHFSILTAAHQSLLEPYVEKTAAVRDSILFLHSLYTHIGHTASPDFYYHSNGLLKRKRTDAMDCELEIPSAKQPRLQ